MSLKKIGLIIGIIAGIVVISGIGKYAISFTNCCSDDNNQTAIIYVK